LFNFLVACTSLSFFSSPLYIIWGGNESCDLTLFF
jgi:hypothetical protein